MAREKTCGNIVTLNHFCLRIPVDAMLRLHGDPMQEAGGAGAMAYFGGSDGRFARVNAVEPVSVLIVGCVDVVFGRANDRVKDFGIAGAERNDRCRRSPLWMWA